MSPDVGYLKLIPFDNTYVLYNPDDIISAICVHFTLLPVYVMVFYTSWFILTREIEPVIAVGGQLVNELINQVIKRVVKEARPNLHKSFGHSSKSLMYGMPSAHSQFISFFCAYYGLTMLIRLRHLGCIEKTLGLAIFSIMMFGVPFSRLYLGYHTLRQVEVGAALGFAIGILFFLILGILRDLGIVDNILDLKICRWFYIKDTYYNDYKSFKDEHEIYVRSRNKKKVLRDKKIY